MISLALAVSPLTSTTMGITVSTPPNDNHDPRDYLDGTGAATETDAETQQRVAEAMEEIRQAQVRENAYEASKYGD